MQAAQRRNKQKKQSNFNLNKSRGENKSRPSKQNTKMNQSIDKGNSYQAKNKIQLMNEEEELGYYEA